MKTSNGMVVTDVEGVCESWASFYRDLFTACPVDLGVQSDLLDCLTLSLSVDDVASFDGPIPLNEVHAAILCFCLFYQQQQNFINKQIKLQTYCLQLARLFEAGQCM